MAQANEWQEFNHYNIESVFIYEKKGDVLDKIKRNFIFVLTIFF